MTKSIIGASNAIEANPGARLLLTARNGAALDAAVLPLSSATWLLSQAINVRGVRKLLVDVQYDAAAATGGFPLIRPLVTSMETTDGADPLYTDDVWSGPLITDGIVTPTALGGTMATGLVEAHGPLQGLQVHREFVMQLPAITANSAKLRASFQLQVDPFLFVRFEVAEGAGANPGSLRLYVTGSA